MSRNALARPWIRSRSGGFALFCGICWSEMTAHVKITRMTAADGPTAASLKSRVAVGCTHVPKKPLEKLANNTRLRVSSEHIYIYIYSALPSGAACQPGPLSASAGVHASQQGDGRIHAGCCSGTSLRPPKKVCCVLAWWWSLPRWYVSWGRL
jgi:hypothetical protein